MTRHLKSSANSSEKPQETIARLEAELADVHDELTKTNSELIQLTLELEDRVDERTEALRRSEAELRRHRDHLQELVDERTQALKAVNATLKTKLYELQASEERFRSLVLTIPDIVYRIDRDGRFTFVNDAIHKLGYDASELLGRHFSEIVLPAEIEDISREKVLDRLTGCTVGEKNAPKLFDERRTGARKTTGLEVHLINKNRSVKPGLLEKISGDTITVEINSAGLWGISEHRGSKKIFIGTVGVIRDISDRKKIESALRESEERLKTILNYAQAGIVLIDAQKRRIVEANPAALALIGADREAVIGSVCHRFICPAEEGRCPVLDLGKRMDSSERVLQQIDGGQLPILKTVAAIQLEGRPYMLESFVDISQLKQAQEALRKAKEDLELKVEERTAELKHSQAKLIQAEKIAAVGTLTAGVAHELNNPMMGIINFIQYSLRHIGADHRIHPVLKDAERETRRCVKIVQNLLTFSRIENPVDEAPQRISLETLFDRVCRLLSYRITKEAVNLKKTVAADLPLLRAKVSNIQQVLLNLMGNALDAVEESEAKEIHFELQATNNVLILALKDSGCGIAAQHLDKIFDPFYTTKPVGQGTGLGLSVSLGIVRDHGGTIACESEPGKGTTFTIRLPLPSENVNNEP